MIYLIIGTVYIASMFIARRYIMREFSACGQDNGAFWICVIPCLNTVAALVFTFFFILDSFGPLVDKATEWFFNKK